MREVLNSATGKVDHADFSAEVERAAEIFRLEETFHSRFLVWTRIVQVDHSTFRLNKLLFKFASLVTLSKVRRETNKRKSVFRNPAGTSRPLPILTVDQNRSFFHRSNDANERIRRERSRASQFCIDRNNKLLNSLGCVRLGNFSGLKVSLNANFRDCIMN